MDIPKWAEKAAIRAIKEQDRGYITQALAKSMYLDNRCKRLECILGDLYKYFEASSDELSPPPEEASVIMRRILTSLSDKEGLSTKNE